MRRKIYCVLMIHTQQEIGSLKEAAVQDLEKDIGADQTAGFFRKVDGYWKLVAKRIEASGLFLPEKALNLHIFVDGLPNAEESLVQMTVNDLIAKGEIPAYQIIEKLRQAGAIVHGTENLDLLLQEVTYWKVVFSNPNDRNRIPELEEWLLQKRDKAIVERINQVVSDGETAIIFIGGLHNVAEPLSQPPYNFEVMDL